MRKIIICFLGILLLSTCAGIAPEIHEFENKEVFKDSFDHIWSAIIETFAERNIPIVNMEKVSGFVATEEMKFSSEYADCGATPVGVKFNSLGPLGRFNVFVKEVSAETYIITITANYRVVTNNPYYKNCVSTGKLEGWFLTTLRSKLR